MTIKYAGLSDRGLVREENQDSWCATAELGLFIVSDGMGGHLGGALASKIVVEALPELIRKRMRGFKNLFDSEAKKQLEGALVELSIQVREQTINEPGLKGMGSTVVLIMIKGSRALVAHMGDSRAYLLRRGRLKQLTKDHSVVQLLIDAGEIKPSEAATHPARNQITRCVGMEGDPLPNVTRLELEPRDRLLLCTDGLTSMLSDEEIGKVLQRRITPKSACRQLVDAANERGGNDNITALIVRIGGVSPSKTGENI